MTVFVCTDIWMLTSVQWCKVRPMWERIRHDCVCVYRHLDADIRTVVRGQTNVGENKT